MFIVRFSGKTTSIPVLSGTKPTLGEGFYPKPSLVFGCIRMENIPTTMSIIVKLFSKQLRTLKKLDPTEVTTSPWAITRGLLGREKWAYHQSSACFFDDFSLAYHV